MPKSFAIFLLCIGSMLSACKDDQDPQITQPTQPAACQTAHCAP